MRILQTTSRFYPYLGGTEQIVSALSKQLVKKGHQVKVICSDEPAVGDGVIEGIEVKRLPYIGKVANSNIPLFLLSELLKEDFDIIHTHLPHPWSADFSAITAAIKNKPLFLTYHNDIAGSGIHKVIANLYNFTALKFLLKSARIIFITQPNYLKSSAFLSRYKEKVVVSPPGVDLEKFKPLNLAKENTKNIFFLSRLDKFHRYKGLDYLLLSVKEIIAKIPLRLYVGGEGELLKEYNEVVSENRLSNAVTFLGKLTPEEVVKYYNLADLFVLPSISAVQEGFGLVALEAMACKKPVIVSDLAGAAEDVKNENCGIVVKPKDTGELAEALEFLLSHPEQAKEMGENAYNLVRNKYTWQRHADIVEREYLKVQ